jgi:hypothetical protein
VEAEGSRDKVYLDLWESYLSIIENEHQR